jgi:hypothetical protein
MACFYSWLMRAQLSQKKETGDVDRMPAQAHESL